MVGARPGRAARGEWFSLSRRARCRKFRPRMSSCDRRTVARSPGVDDSVTTSTGGGRGANAIVQQLNSTSPHHARSRRGDKTSPEASKRVTSAGAPCAVSAFTHVALAGPRKRHTSERTCARARSTVGTRALFEYRCTHNTVQLYSSPIARCACPY